MKENRLRNTLRAMVEEHGILRVERALDDIRKATKGSTRSSRSSTGAIQDYTPRARQRKRAKITAAEYVSKLELPSETMRLLKRVAVKFEEKMFLPTFEDIRNFCATYGLDTPASPSRISAIPRIFKYLAKLAPHDIHTILQANSSSGPTRLAPIADAIRRSSEQRVGAHSSLDGENDSLPDTPETKEELAAKPPMPSKI